MSARRGYSAHHLARAAPKHVLRQIFAPPTTVVGAGTARSELPRLADGGVVYVPGRWRLSSVRWDGRCMGASRIGVSALFAPDERGRQWRWRVHFEPIRTSTRHRLIVPTTMGSQLRSFHEHGRVGRDGQTRLQHLLWKIAAGRGGEGTHALPNVSIRACVPHPTHCGRPRPFWVHNPESPWDTAVRHSAAGFRVVCHPCGKRHVRDLHARRRDTPDWSGTLTSHVWTRVHHGRYKFTPPKRRVWKAEQTFQNAFSKHFSRL